MTNLKKEQQAEVAKLVVLYQDKDDWFKLEDKLYNLDDPIDDLTKEIDELQRQLVRRQNSLANAKAYKAEWAPVYTEALVQLRGW